MCRTANLFDINGLGQMKDGRGNICPVTIILPTLAMQVKEKNGTIDDFFKLLDKKIGEAKDMLIERFNHICSQSPKSAAFMWDNNVMTGYIPEEGIRSALKHGTLVIGQLGLAEALQLLIGTIIQHQKDLSLQRKLRVCLSNDARNLREGVQT